MGFSKQDYWSGLPFPPPGNLPAPGTELAALMSPALAGGLFTTSATWEAPSFSYLMETIRLASERVMQSPGRYSIDHVLNFLYFS